MGNGAGGSPVRPREEKNEAGKLDAVFGGAGGMRLFCGL